MRSGTGLKDGGRLEKISSGCNPVSPLTPVSASPASNHDTIASLSILHDCGDAPPNRLLTLLSFINTHFTMSSGKQAYPFAAQSASSSSANPRLPPQPQPQRQQPQSGFAHPRPPVTLQHSPLNQQSQRRPFVAPATPSASPNSSAASLLLPPNQRGPPAGSPGRPNASLMAPNGRGGPPLKSKNSDSSLVSVNQSGLYGCSPDISCCDRE